MSSHGDSERIDTLFALALAFGDTRRHDDGEDSHSPTPADGGQEGARPVADALELLSGLNASERLAAERRAEWYSRLTEKKRREWMLHVLGNVRARKDGAQLDEHIHPTHIAEALLGEPAHIRRLVINHLPPALAALAAAALGLQTPEQSPPHETGDATDLSSPVEATARRRGKRAATGSLRGSARPAETADGAPANNAPHTGTQTRTQAPEEIVAIVRRVFLSNFVSLTDLSGPTPLDLLSGAELARLIRLAGTRETAVACRGIANVEAVGSFLRRFAVEDARAIAAHITTLTDIEPRRVAFAERIVHEALSGEPEVSAMLIRAGLQVLAVTLAGGGEARLRYTAQKLPVEVARWLYRMAEAAGAGEAAPDAERRALMRLVARETEALAARLRRPPPPPRRPAAAKSAAPSGAD
jgi:hypothetical protein